jgi:hypothetical protein
MKKLILSVITVLLSLSVFGQAKKPTLMVIPSDAWCNKNGFTEKFDNQGTIEILPDYKLALQSSSELNNVISKIGILMTEKGFPLKDLSATIRSNERRTAMNNVTTSKRSGAAVLVSPLDLLKQTAKADIILELDYTVNQTGPKKSVTYNLRGIDAYTNKQIAGAQGTGTPSFTADIPVLLEEAVTSNMDNFASQLQTYFDDLFANGREVTVGIQMFENPEGIDLESEFGGKQLTEIIEEWMAQNTVQHRFNKSDASDNFILFEQVRIPLYRENEMAMDTEAFVRQLQKYLKAAPYNLISKIDQRGLGECILIIGDK